ncbi:MAG TPA: putative Ig domain-containing protein [Candidatus Dormibacteraeota bacterium]
MRSGAARHTPRTRLLRTVATALGAAVLLATLSGGLRATPVAAIPIPVNAVTVTTTNDVVDGTTTSIAALIASPGPDGRISLREAILAATNTVAASTITVPGGTFGLTRGELQVGASGSNVTINGAGAGTTTIQQTDGVNRVLNLDPGQVGNVTVAISGVTITGGHDTGDGFGGAGIIGGNASPADSLTLSSCAVTGNTVTSTGTASPGGGISWAGGNLTISGCTISNNDSGTSAGGGVSFTTPTAASGSLSITGSTITGNTARSADPSNLIGGGGIYVHAVAGSTVSIRNDTLTGNSVTATGGAPAGGGAVWAQGAATIAFNRIVGNTAAGGGATGVEYDNNTGTAATAAATDNWWGCNAGPGNAGCDSVASGGTGTSGTGGGTLGFTPWLQLTAAAVPAKVVPAQTSTVTGSLTHDSNGVDTSAAGHVPDGTTMSFAGTLGGVSPSSQPTSSGVAVTVFTAGAVAGSGSTALTVDHQTVTAAIGVGTAPHITSASTATFTATTFGTFTVTGTGSATIVYTETGSLPSGVTLSAGGVLSGTPASGTQGDYPITITAANGYGSNDTQGFTLTVQPLTQAPAITSAAATTLTEGVAGSFTETATGIPSPVLGMTGSLPTGVSFTAATGVLAGTPAAGTHGTYPLTFTAANGVATDASQSFILTVGLPPQFTSAGSATFTAGTPGTFPATATGFPAPAFSESGALPAGVTFDTGTHSFTGTPGAASGGVYQVTLTAANGIGSDATQGFTLTVNQAPAITSAGAATFTVGTPGSFPVTVTGYPAPSLVAGGDVPSGVSLSGGALTGTPAAGTGGAHAITLTASNGAGTDAVQSFTLTVDEAPSFSSAAQATFTVGSPGSFTLTGGGFPAPAFSSTGALPGGVSLSGGVLSGTPDAGTGGTWHLALTATNGIGIDATQAFTLTVDEGPAFTSADHATFTVGANGSFSVSASGTPSPTLKMTGTLPPGVTFDASTGLLSGIPQAPGGSTSVDVTAHNGIGSDAVQHFTLTVDEAPAITSVASTSFLVGAPGTFTVTAGGFPAPSLSESGALPSGVTFSGATLSGTPDPGTAGDYPLTITAHNSTQPDATQAFTLHVDQVLAFSSAGNVTFTTAASGSFPVTATGFPAPAVSESGALPSGVTFSGGALHGTPAAGTGGVYPLTFTASDGGVEADAVQSFTLTVDQAPAITSANTLALTTGSPAAFTVTATGYPAPSITESGTLPSGVSVTGGVFSGTPVSGSAGSYPITLTAANGVLPDAVQSFTLTVTNPTATTITSSALRTLLNGPVTFTATVAATFGTGTPTGTVTFKDGGSTLGTGTLALVGGVATATYTTSGLSAATHSITAGYGGDATDAVSASTALSQVVTTVASVILTPHSHTLRANGTSHTSAVVVVTDAGGQPVAGDTVTFTSTPAGAVTFNAATAITDSSGSAATTITSSTTAGSVTLTATESIGSVTGTAKEKLLGVRFATRALVSGHIAANGASTAVAMVTVVDGSGAPVSGETITFQTEGHPGDAALAHPTVDTDSGGAAADTITSSTTAGTQAIIVSDQNADPADNFSTVLALTQTPAAGSTNASWLHNAYVTLMGRDADPAAFAYWLDRLNHGTARTTVAEALASSPEYRTDVIGGTSTVPGFYQQYLARPTDLGGVVFWLGYMAAGHSLEQVRTGFLGSAEYPLHHGPDPATTIDALYEDILGRPSDPTGRAYWLANYNAATIAIQFIQSPEGRAHLVSALYGAILIRPADSVGLAYWTQQLLNGATDEHVIGGLLGSDEYFLSH